MTDDTAPEAPQSGMPGPMVTDAVPEPEPDATSPIDTPATETPAGEPTEHKHHSSFLRELPILIAVALILALVIKAFLVQAFYIPSGSMENTLHVGDRVLVNKLVYRFRSVHRGEIVVFNGDSTSFQPEVIYSTPHNPITRFFRSFASAIGVAPPGEKDFIKRVIGVGGDHVKCCDAHNRITVNGHPLTEPYLFPGNSPSDQQFNVTVPKDHIWVMGDHRAASQDSRAYIDAPGGGFVPTNKVIGRAFVKVWPPSHMGTLPVPKTFRSLAASVLRPVSKAPSLALGVIAVTPIGLARRRARRRRRRAQARLRASSRQDAGPAVR